MFSRLVIALGISALLAAGLNNLDMGKLKTVAQDKFDRVFSSCRKVLKM